MDIHKYITSQVGTLKKYITLKKGFRLVEG